MTPTYLDKHLKSIVKDKEHPPGHVTKANDRCDKADRKLEQLINY